jgi:dTDP-4-amino-4,6-dideoxygalactose transaminase
MSDPTVVPLNDLHAGWLASDDEVRDAVSRVLASGWYIKGPEHDAFEAELAEYVGVAHAVGLASGTDALVLSLLAVGCGPESEVVTVANAGGYSSIAASIIGARVAYADVEPTTLLATAETVRAALGPDTRAVVITHLYGNVADAGAIAALCRARKIAVVEDCAQAIGGEYDGRRAGTFGDVAALSFYPTKNLGAAGDGGAIATDDPAIADRVRSLRQYGWSPRYVVSQANGRNSRLDEIQAAILRIGLRRVEGFNERRREIVRRYNDTIRGSGIRLVTGAGTPTVAHLAVVRATDRVRVRAMFAAARVATDIHYPVPDHRQPGLSDPSRVMPLPETERAAEEILTIPCYPSMTEDAVAQVCTVLTEASAG